MWVPFLMCLVLTGIHAYLGLHVIAREVVFVDIALAQIASLGATAAFLWGYDLESWGSYAFGLTFTILGASVFALTRTRERRVSQEAIIGVVYAVSSAAAVLVADRTPHGAEHLRNMLVGSILAVGGREVVKVAGLYAIVGLFHWLCRRPFLLISTDPDRAYRDGWRVRWWDFLFYASFGVVVTSSVRIAGVLLVFSYLIVPTLAANLLGGSISRRLAIAWTFGTLVSVLAMGASAVFDTPTGATVVCAFGLILLILAIAGCGESPPPDGKPLVVASFFPIYDFARRVAADRAQVISLVPPGVHGHDWEPSPQDVAQVRRARLFVYNGAGFEPWADKLIKEAVGPSTAVVAASAGLTIARTGGGGAVDPHVWLDPVLA